MIQSETAYCYYSNFNLFENTSKLVKKEKFVRSLLQNLGEGWRIYAGYSITIELDGQINYMAWQFCFENLLFAWMDNEDLQYQEFFDAAVKRISPYSLNPAYFKSVLDGFYYTAQELWQRMKLSRPPSQEFMSLDQIKQEEMRPMSNILKPLVLVSEKIISYFKKDEVVPEQVQQPRWKQISKLTQESLPIDLVESAYVYVSQFIKKTYQNCQVAKSFIVNIIELNNEVLSRYSIENAAIKVRIMQPSSLMYDNLLSIWTLANVGIQPQYFDLVTRTKALLGENWKDNFQQPVELFFQMITKIYGNILVNPQIKAEDQINQLLMVMRQQMAQMWEIEIVQQSYQ